MKIAVQIGANDQTADPGWVAKEAEARGFEGLFFPEHTHIPIERPQHPTAEHLIRLAGRFYSPFVNMAWAASTTKTLTVGTCVGLPVQHDPIVLAKALASLDVMTGGRVVYGFGFGWLPEEIRDHGVDFKRRRAVMREKMLAAKALWTEEEASFSGEFVNFPPCIFYPKPPPGRLPILLGAQGTDSVLDHVIEYCDGWVPPLYEGFFEGVGRLRARAEAAGRDPASLLVNVIANETRLSASGDPMRLMEDLRGAGVERAILPLPYSRQDDVRRALDDYAARFLQAFSD